VMIGGSVLMSRCTEQETCSLNNWADLGKTVDGDLIATASAFVYACYSILTKFCMGDGRKISMPLVFGFIGIVNFISLWPLFLVLPYTNEPVNLPTKYSQWLLLTLCGLSSVVSDYFMARAIVLTSPLLVSVGLCLTIPMALIYDIYDKSETRHPSLYLVGALGVFVGFLLVNMQVAQSLEQEQQTAKLTSMKE